MEISVERDAQNLGQPVLKSGCADQGRRRFGRKGARRLEPLKRSDRILGEHASVPWCVAQLERLRDELEGVRG